MQEWNGKCFCKNTPETLYNFYVFGTCKEAMIRIHVNPIKHLDLFHVNNNSLLISSFYRWNFVFFLKCQQKWFSWVEYFMAPYFWFSFGNILMKMISCWHLCKKWRGTRNFRIWRLRHYYLLNLSSLKYFSSGSNFPSSGIRAWNNTLRDSSRRSFIHNKPQEHSLKKNNNSL